MKKPKTRRAMPLTYNTKQREWLSAFWKKHLDQAFTAKQIAEQLSATDAARISLSAVYRNLAAMEEEGLLRASVREGSREKRYQFVGASACQNRLHLSCVSCGQISHLDPAAMAKVDRAIATSGFALLHDQTTLYGTCTACRHRKHS